ncbi:MAG TPA: hypothetical protein PK185_05895 [Cyclobacteriaceae bacterium]|nr:hypothetical protein [Cyclobacteriaceae bacterium]
METDYNSPIEFAGFLKVILFTVVISLFSAVVLIKEAINLL